MDKDVNKETDVTSLGGCLIRVFTTLLGPVFLIICAVILAVHRSAFPSTLDIIYGVILILIVIARLIDRPMPTDKPAETGNEPAAQSCRVEHSPVIKYSIIIFVAGIALWVVARLILSQLF